MPFAKSEHGKGGVISVYLDGRTLALFLKYCEAMKVNHNSAAKGALLGFLEKWAKVDKGVKR